MMFTTPPKAVGAVERGAGAPHDLDALDVLDADGERLPDRRADEVDVHAPAVDEHERLVAQPLVEAADRDLRLRARHLHQVDAREATEQLRHLGDAREPDVLLGDDRDRVGGVEHALRAARSGDDLLLEGVLPRRRARRGRGRGRRLRGAGAGLGRRRGLRGRRRIRRGPGRTRRRRALGAELRLEPLDDALDLLAVGRVLREVTAVDAEGLLGVAGFGVRAPEVVEHARVREDLVGEVQLADAFVEAALADGVHASLEVRAGVGARVGRGHGGHGQDGERDRERRADRPRPRRPRSRSPPIGGRAL